MRLAQPSIPLAHANRTTPFLYEACGHASSCSAMPPVGRDTRAYLESQDDHRMRLPAHMARAVLEAYPDDEPVVSPDAGWRTL